MIGFCNIQNIPQNAGMCLGPAKHLTYDADHVGPCREPIRLGRDGHPLHDYLASPGWRTTPFTPELTRTRFSSSEGCSGTVLAHYEACHGSPTMDNWGDPWADNADNAKSPTKPAVTSPLPPSFAPPPAFLGGTRASGTGRPRQPRTRESRRPYPFLPPNRSRVSNLCGSRTIHNGTLEGSWTIRHKTEATGVP
jgi:hypothetical protein